MINKRNPDIVSNTVLRDMDEAVSLSASEQRFQFGFAWLDMVTWTVRENDPRIAVPAMRQVDWTFKPYI